MWKHLLRCDTTVHSPVVASSRHGMGMPCLDGGNWRAPWPHSQAQWPLDGGDVVMQLAARLTVPSGPSVACSTAAAIAWDKAWANNLDPSGRAAVGVHDAAYENGEAEEGAAKKQKTDA